MTASVMDRLARWVPATLLWLSAATFLVAWSDYGSPWTLRAASVASLEFIGIFAGGILFFVLGIQAKAWRERIVQWALALVVLYLFLLGAWRDHGSNGVIDLLLIVFLTYSGVLFARTSARRDLAMGEMVIRLFLSLIVLVFASNVSGLPNKVNDWGTAREALVCSAIYFGLLGCLEATGMYVAMRRHWSEKAPQRLSRLELDERERATSPEGASGRRGASRISGRSRRSR